MKIHGTVTDAAAEKPLAKAKVVLYVGETELATLYTSKEGLFEIERDIEQYRGQDLICKVTKEQFEPKETAYKIGSDDIGINIELVATKPVEPKPDIPTPPPEPNSNKKMIIIGGAVCAVIVAAIVIYFTHPKPVKIVSFKAEPSTIVKNQSSTLTWETENAVKVTIDEIGKVEFSGSKSIRPQKTTTYTLIAKGEKDELSETSTVEVRIPVVPLPDLYISEFSLSPSTPTQGRPVTVRIGVYNRGSAKAKALTIEWWAGEKFPRPAKVWQFKEIAAKGGRTWTYRYDGYTSWYPKLTTKVIADSKGQVKEQDEHNNVKKLEIQVRKK